jgi:hypothetical protein
MVAEEALKRSDTALAQKLGYHLCQCTYPPQIMLWQESRGCHVCPNPACGRNTAKFHEPLPRPGSAWSP